MLFWILLTAITAAVVAAVVRPLLRARSAPLAGRAAYDRAIYRDQLAEVERDRARGVIGDTEAEAARHEVERRLLATTRGGGAATPAGGGPVRSWRAAAVIIVVPLIALGMYWKLGSPGMPAEPAAENAAADAAAEASGAPHQESNASLETAAKGLEKRLAQNPNDANGWLLLARTRAVLRQWRESEIAFEKAINLTNGAPDALAGYGEMIVMSANGTVSPTALSFFQRAVAKDPKNVVAQFYLGLADVQAGKPAEAVARWRKLAADAPPNATWFAPLNAQIVAAAKSAGIKPSPEELAAASGAATPPASETPSSATPGPTQEQMRAAQNMSPADREKMIRGMVQRLADQLKAHPNDPAGWQRLARAYDVLGEHDKAQEALSHVKGAATAPAMPGPTQEQMRAAQNMSPADREQMIRGMVQRLADRLKAHPDDPAGWQRLARAYDVLGEHDKAREALSHVKGATSEAAPSMPGPTQEQVAAAQNMSPEDRQKMIHGMVDRLAARMKANPGDADGWMRLGRAYTVLGESDKAVAALGHAAKLRPNDPQPLVGEAEAILATVPMDGSKPLPPSFLAVAKKLESMSADSPDALWYIGLAAKQEKRIAVARANWTKLLGKLDPASREAKMVKGALDKLGK